MSYVDLTRLTSMLS